MTQFHGDDANPFEVIDLIQTKNVNPLTCQDITWRKPRLPATVTRGLTTTAAPALAHAASFTNGENVGRR